MAERASEPLLTRCLATTARYALRCKLAARTGHLTCPQHADQEDWCEANKDALTCWSGDA